MLFVYITTQDKEEARKIGKILVEKKLAACINILDPMESLYWWEGKIEAGKESVLIAKTDAAHFEALSTEVKKNHSYSCPCIVALPIQDGNPDYLKWLGENLD